MCCTALAAELLGNSFSPLFVGNCTGDRQIGDLGRERGPTNAAGGETEGGLNRFVRWLPMADYTIEIDKNGFVLHGWSMRSKRSNV